MEHPKAEARVELKRKRKRERAQESWEKLRVGGTRLAGGALVSEKYRENRMPKPMP